MNAVEELVVVTGRSGSGKSIALHTLEDQGWYCIDNLPVFMLEGLGRQLLGRRDDRFERTAVGIDARSDPDGLARLPRLVGDFADQGVHCRILYLDAGPEVLIRRFSETRRKHPLSRDGHPLAEALALEQRLLEPIRLAADMVIDTSRSNVHQLRDLVREQILGSTGSALMTLLESFGFKHGVPGDADFVFDVRCLPNPHWQTELRPLTGLDDEVRTYLEDQDDVIRMRADLLGFIERWLPAFEAEGRSYLTLAVGCTGGQHRSVYMVDWLAHRLGEAGRQVRVHHRELA